MTKQEKPKDASHGEVSWLNPPHPRRHLVISLQCLNEPSQHLRFCVQQCLTAGEAM